MDAGVFCILFIYYHQTDGIGSHDILPYSTVLDSCFSFKCYRILFLRSCSFPAGRTAFFFIARRRIGNIHGSAGPYPQDLCGCSLGSPDHHAHLHLCREEDLPNSIRDDNKKQAWKCAIRDAIDEINTLSLSRKISCALVPIDADTSDAIRDPVLGISSEHPEVLFSLDYKPDQNASR